MCHIPLFVTFNLKVKSVPASVTNRVRAVTFLSFKDGLFIFGMYVDHLQTMCRVPLLVTFDLKVKSVILP